MISTDIYMFSIINSDIVITRSNATWFSVQHCNVWSRTQIRYFDKFVAWLARFWPWVKTGIGFRWYWPWFAWFANWMGWKLHRPPSVRAAKCTSPRKVRGPTQCERTHTKRAEPRKARGLHECVGRGSIARAALSARAAIAWRGEWDALPPHLPRTWHEMPTQCNRGSTRVGRDKPQSPGTFRVKNYTFNYIYFFIFDDASVSGEQLSHYQWCQTT